MLTWHHLLRPPIPFPSIAIRFKLRPEYGRVADRWRPDEPDSPPQTHRPNPNTHKKICVARENRFNPINKTPKPLPFPFSPNNKYSIMAEPES
ncbi:hypothetical protein COLO4_20493 [Corchorus olitorius]|uniref:Uncharacterized protein n=1 Tax=Corchorus olitorius TaxID=93759 RepID=A0A1R3IZN2_9ROSI|nr:hypothetical protein COLO4_20493 [Corchorus olitorius]